MKWNKHFAEKVIKGIPVYEIGHYGPEHNMVYYRVFRKSKALKLFEKVRLDLLADARHMLAYNKRCARKILKQGYDEYDEEKKPLDADAIKYYTKEAKYGDEMWMRMIKSLKEKDPEKIDNYPHETPFLNKEHIKF